MTPSPAATLNRVFPDGVFPSACPSRVLLTHVTSKWGVLVLVALADGTLRWSELRHRAQGISDKMLAQTLRTLEADALVHRDARPVIPPHVEYRLTPLGEELVTHLVPLMAWIATHAEQVVSATEVDGAAPAAGQPSPSSAARTDSAVASS